VPKLNKPKYVPIQQQQKQGPKHQDNSVSLSGQETHDALKNNLGNYNIQH